MVKILPCSKHPKMSDLFTVPMLTFFTHVRTKSVSNIGLVYKLLCLTYLKAKSMRTFGSWVKQTQEYIFDSCKTNQ